MLRPTLQGWLFLQMGDHSRETMDQGPVRAGLKLAPTLILQPENPALPDTLATRAR